MDFIDVQRATYTDLATSYEEFGDLFTRKWVALCCCGWNVCMRNSSANDVRGVGNQALAPVD